MIEKMPNLVSIATSYRLKKKKQLNNIKLGASPGRDLGLDLVNILSRFFKSINPNMRLKV